MLEAETTVASPDDVHGMYVGGMSTGQECPAGRVTSPQLAAFLADNGDPAPAARPSTEEEARLPSWDWPSATSLNNNCVRHPPTKPEVDLALLQTGSRTAEVATALAGVHSVLERIRSMTEKQQVLGDVIVRLQVLRCWLQLYQVNIKCNKMIMLTATATMIVIISY